MDHEGNIRRHADFVLQQLVQEGHRLFLLESAKDDGGKRVLKDNRLFKYFEDTIPLDKEFPVPDYVIDANPDWLQGHTPGFQIPYYNYYAMLEDEEILEAYRQIQRITGAPGPPPRMNVRGLNSGSDDS
jgi:hypothetical protein